MQTSPELLRLIHNIVRIGTVSEIDPGAPPPDYKPPRVRVATGDITTGWLHWRESRVGTTRTWNPPTPGEQVLVIAPGGILEGAIVMPGIYQKALPPPTPTHDLNVTMVELPDGATLVYDHERSHLEATLPGSATITAQGDIAVTTEAAMTLTAKGGLTIDGDTKIQGKLSIAGGAVTHNGTDIGDTHRHKGVMSGSSISKGPV
ncbi:phage baseplate assembly protein V [Modicisalibacter sp. MOD 31.J]|uniref:phage baseplate assembly protein V n=1 Tax=Modicisalibacter sp. MOD 31.J TaxID=2831897 RepID=UPI001CCCC31E|nr:phage baseplate assembly protein V [Modicisalibacter sp. MOD 31.J]MBZ9576725.1 phage baseplate assembly protein V [Modicisalibacter sp. MOD 31.J]